MKKIREEISNQENVIKGLKASIIRCTTNTVVWDQKGGDTECSNQL